MRIDHSLQEQMLLYLSAHEYKCLLQTTGAADIEDLNLFVK